MKKFNIARMFKSALIVAAVISYFAMLTLKLHLLSFLNNSAARISRKRERRIDKPLEVDLFIGIVIVFLFGGEAEPEGDSNENETDNGKH